MARSICPWWFGYFLASPLRRLRHDPAAILGPHVMEGMAAGLQGRVDFVLAFAVVHELPDIHRFFREASIALKPGGKLLF